MILKKTGTEETITAYNTTLLSFFGLEGFLFVFADYSVDIQLRFSLRDSSNAWPSVLNLIEREMVVNEEHGRFFENEAKWRKDRDADRL
ncbi:hypothetical protein NCCP2222_13620 [Sporosarcina sp. NCCP-2222]|nr:hypothetical protein NCCP2222_13620 [Sporosarcina sp. NCCP-2222]